MTGPKALLFVATTIASSFGPPDGGGPSQQTPEAQSSKALHAAPPPPVPPLFQVAPTLAPEPPVLMAPPQAAAIRPQAQPKARDDQITVPTTPSVEAWFEAVGKRRHQEAFGSLVVRAARVPLGTPYKEATEDTHESVEADVATFQCVSFVESSLAVARCVWNNAANRACFVREITSMRYRNGMMEGFASRLHYFEDWLTDNAKRGHVNLLTASLGGVPVTRPTSYMTRHADNYLVLQDAGIRRAIAEMETHVTKMSPNVLDRNKVARAQHSLKDGDLVAIATRRKGILIRHAGLVARDPHGKVHLLHASSAKHRVVMSPQTLAAYMNAKAIRQGILVARPLPPA